MIDINTLPDSIIKWLHQHNWSADVHITSLFGGCINQNYLIESESGEQLFIKTHPSPPPQFFIKEANNLRALQATNTVRVPQVLFADDYGLILEYIAPGRENSNFWRIAAEQLAALHNTPQSSFGFLEDNYCGLTPQRNNLHTHGHSFFFHERLLPQADLALKNKYFSSQDYQQLLKLEALLPSLIPDQNPSLVHGDLWNGNFYCDQEGQPVFIDPACYWGWPETDLALSNLFGGVAPMFYEHYINLHPEAQAWHSRQDIYNLYHILNHLNLFGSSYYAQAKQTLNYYIS